MQVFNRIWQRNYSLVEEMEAGVQLTGAEAKSTHAGHVKLDAGYIRIKDSRPVLLNVEIFRYQYDGSPDYNPTRPRNLLLNKKEILRLETKMVTSPGLTIVPIAMYTKGRKIKVKIGLVQGRKDTEKRRLERKNEIRRTQEREVKDFMKR